MQENSINIKLRQDILEQSLHIESMINQLLLVFLNINKIGTKTLSNKSSSLSFKNKIDLLYDLDRLTKPEYTKFILFMEIRNQFIHNIDCSTFLILFNILGNDRRLALLKYENPRDANLDEEIRLLFSFNALFLDCLSIILSKIEAQKDFIESQRKAAIAPINEQITQINGTFDKAQALLSYLIPSKKESDEIIQLKTELVEEIMALFSTGSKNSSNIE
jgi:hypothetical protein